MEEHVSHPPRKKKAPTLRAWAWEPYKARLYELHITQDLPLREVQRKIEEEYGFTAQLRQYQTRIAQWGWKKYINTQEMQAIVRKRQQRRLVETDKGDLAFEVDGVEVEERKIERWMRNHGISGSLLYEPSSRPSTPLAVRCRTISDRGSPVPSTPPSPIISSKHIERPYQDLQSFSPSVSIVSIFGSQSLASTLNIPAPSEQVSAGTFLGTISASDVMQEQLNALATCPQSYSRQREEARLREELSRTSLTFGSNASRSLRISTALARVLMDQRRYKSAEEVLHNALSSYHISGSSEVVDTRTLDAYDLLGRVSYYQGHYLQAENIYRRTIALKRNILGDQHASTLYTKQFLAWALVDRDWFQPAETELSQIIVDQQARKGASHPDTLMSMVTLSISYFYQGRAEEAAKLQSLVAATRLKTLGCEHKETLNSLDELASTLRDQGRLEEAESLQVRILETSSQAFGKADRDRLHFLFNFALLRRMQQRDGEAVESMRECHEERLKLLGAQHPDTMSSLWELNEWQMEDFFENVAMEE